MKLVSIVVAFAISSVGCSFLFMQRPPARESLRRNIEPGCSGRGFPALDTVLAVGNGLNALLFFALASNPVLSADALQEDRRELRTAGTVFALAAVTHMVSGVWGFSTAGECRDIKSEWYALQFGMRPLDQFSPAVIRPVPDPPPELPTDSGPRMPGSERGRCRPTAPLCAGDLVCASDYCVRPAQAPVEPAPGTERGHCRSTEPACDAGLVCASTFCVRPPDQ